jgi:GntP family gluconate:H+ symporter
LISLTTVFELAHEGAAKGAGWGVAMVNGLGGEEGFTAVRAWVDFIGHKNIALIIGAADFGRGAGQAAWLWLEESGRADGTAAGDGVHDHPHHQRRRSVWIRPCVRPAWEVRWRVLAKDYSLNLATWLARGGGGARGAGIRHGGDADGRLDHGADGGGRNLGCHPLYMFCSIGFGAMFCSWMNDSGFWVVNRLSGMTEKETLRTWSVQLTADSVIGLLVTLVLSKVLPMV